MLYSEVYVVKERVRIIVHLLNSEHFSSGLIGPLDRGRIALPKVQIKADDISVQLN